MSPTREPSDHIRGVGAHHSRVPLAMVDSYRAATFMPDDPEGTPIEQTARVMAREQVVRFMEQWARLTPRRAAIVQMRFLGLTWREIGKRLGGVTPQAGEKLFRSAVSVLPELAAYFDPLWNRKGHPRADG